MPDGLLRFEWNGFAMNYRMMKALLAPQTACDLPLLQQTLNLGLSVNW